MQLIWIVYQSSVPNLCCVVGLSTWTQGTFRNLILDFSGSDASFYKTYLGNFLIFLFYCQSNVCYSSCWNPKLEVCLSFELLWQLSFLSCPRILTKGNILPNYKPGRNIMKMKTAASLLQSIPSFTNFTQKRNKIL